jgi:C4-dicarboxylate-specific signal transduction histidine kinase
LLVELRKVERHAATPADRCGATRVHVRMDWSGNGGGVRGDQNRVRQIFANLVTNELRSFKRCLWAPFRPGVQRTGTG